MADQPSEPKIIIDSDWKAQAQREKERLAAQERELKAKSAPRPASSAAAGAGTGAGAGAGSGNFAMPPAPGLGGGASASSASAPASAANAEYDQAGASMPSTGAERMPPADFEGLLSTLVTQALLYTGGFPDPQTGRAIVSLEHARFYIDLLAVLEEKTRGNLSPQEAEGLTGALGELRMRFVEIARAVAQASKEGRVSRMSPGGIVTGGSGGPAAGLGGMGGM